MATSYHLFSEGPVSLVIDVKPFNALDEEGREHVAGDRAAVEDNSGPGDFETGVLDVDFR